MYNATTIGHYQRLHRQFEEHHTAGKEISAQLLGQMQGALEELSKGGANADAVREVEAQVRHQGAEPAIAFEEHHGPMIADLVARLADPAQFAQVSQQIEHIFIRST